MVMLNTKEIARKYSLSDIIEKHAEIQKVAVNPALARTGARGLKWLGESLGHLAWGAEGGLKLKQVVEPLRRGGALTPVRPWRPLAGPQRFGKIRQIEQSGPLKGMYKYDPKATGGEIYKTEALPKDLAGNITQRLKNIPRFLGQEIFRGRTPTRGDELLFQLSKQRGVTPGALLQTKDPTLMKELVKSQGSAKHFATKYPGFAQKHFGKKWGHRGLMLGLPAHGVYSAINDPIPGESTGKRIGQSLAFGVGFPLAMPFSWGLGFGTGMPGITTGLDRAGGYIGDKTQKLLGIRDRAPQQYNQNSLARPINTYQDVASYPYS